MAITQVYLVSKNADFTQGLGPMLPVKVFSTVTVAREYVSNQPGILGSKQELFVNQNEPVCPREYWNGYEIERMELFSSPTTAMAADEETVRKQAMAKLSAAEKKALGLD